ncbi:MAG: tyrosine-protein phosphatase [Desulfobacteraceae bacterium]|nr:tyrosine-protein phosphatase [Desulfobacteraceae bacterium]
MNHNEKKITLSDIQVRRIDSETVELCWQPKNCKPTISVCAGLRRKDVLQKVPVGESNNGCVKINGLDPGTRHYYHVVDEDGSRLLTAERRVFLEGTVNFRDIGGYKTSDGREVKWGKVFRSDGLARLTDKDHQVLSQMGIERVFDFRSPAEVSEAPDKLPEDGSIIHVNLPVTYGSIDFVDAMARLKQGDASWLTPDFMVNSYIRNIEEFAGAWGDVINFIADSKGTALLFHCTGGKDRTGTCAALILLMLGVDEETVVKDHQLSNTYIADMLPFIFKLIASYGVDPDKLVPYFTAPLNCIQALLNHLQNKYGSASEYLAKNAGVKKETQELLKEKLLR